MLAKQLKLMRKYVIGTLGAGLLINLVKGKGARETSQGCKGERLDKVKLEQVKKYLELKKEQLLQVRIFNVASLCNKFWNRALLSKQT